jgi:cell division protein FtsA
MNKKQVAIIDVGSSEIRAIVGEKGVNNTFIIKGRSSFAYEGFSDCTFFDVDGLRQALISAGDFLKSVARSDVNTIYVGVPGAFTQVFVKGSQISFPKTKKITNEDVANLYDAAFVVKSSDTSLINRSAVVFELNDFRRMAYPVGVQSEILKGKLSFITCNNYFIDCVKPALITAGFSNVEFISTSLAEALYLFDAESRDRIAILVDVGYIATTFSVIQGDGIIYQRSFSFGGGFITANLAEKYQMDFSKAETLKRKVNLSRLSSRTALEVLDGEDNRYYNIDEIKTLIENCLDGFCEEVLTCIDQVPFKIPEYVPLKITGGGISFIRGAKEFVASRLGMLVENIAPQVPLMDNPLQSSCLSLLNLALEQ